MYTTSREKIINLYSSGTEKIEINKQIDIRYPMFTEKFNITKAFILSKSINLLQFQSRSQQGL